MVDLKYIEVNATVDADVVVDLEHVLDSLSLEGLKHVKIFVIEAIKCYEEKDDSQNSKMEKIEEKLKVD